MPTIIDKTSVCGCPTGQEPDGENCVVSTCTDGTPVGECSTTSNEGNYSNDRWKGG